MRVPGSARQRDNRASTNGYFRKFESYRYRECRRPKNVALRSRVIVSVTPGAIAVLEVRKPRPTTSEVCRPVRTFQSRRSESRAGGGVEQADLVDLERDVITAAMAGRGRANCDVLARRILTERHRDDVASRARFGDRCGHGSVRVEVRPRGSHRDHY